MPKYYTYKGKQVGFVRKMVDEVILVEEAWTNEVRQHFAKNGYDPLLEIVARIMSAGGHPPVTRASLDHSKGAFERRNPRNSPKHI